MPVAPELVIVENKHAELDIHTHGSRIFHDYFEVTCDFGKLAEYVEIRPEAAEVYSAVALALEADSFE